MGSLALLSQSRGAALARSPRLVVVVALVPGGRLRRVCALRPAARGRAARPARCWTSTTPARRLPSASGTAPRSRRWRGAGRRARRGRGATWRWSGARSPARDAARVRPAGAGALAAAALVAAGGVIASAGRIERSVSQQCDAFVQPRRDAPGAPSDPRLAVRRGHPLRLLARRLDAFGEQPLLGVGAGNYDRRYFQTRRTTEDMRQPHSIELQALSELGLVGGAAARCLPRRAWPSGRGACARGRRSPAARTLMVGAVGVVRAWLVHTSVDWIHLMPGVTGIALRHGGRAPAARREARATWPAPDRLGARALAAVGSPAPSPPVGPRRGRREPEPAGPGRACSTTAPRRARRRDPADAIREANRSLRLDAEDPRTYYVKAAALARFNQADGGAPDAAARRRQGADDFVTWTLLGDLAIRRGTRQEACRNYARASALNPVDAALRSWPQDPRPALGEQPMTVATLRRCSNASILITAACSSGCGAVGVAQEPEPGVTVDPNSPSSKEYAIPIDKAREDAAEPASK